MQSVSAAADELHDAERGEPPHEAVETLVGARLFGRNDFTLTVDGAPTLSAGAHRVGALQQLPWPVNASASRWRAAAGWQ